MHPWHWYLGLCKWCLHWGCMHHCSRGVSLSLPTEKAAGRFQHFNYQLFSRNLSLGKFLCSLWLTGISSFLSSVSLHCLTRGWTGTAGVTSTKENNANTLILNPAKCFRILMPEWHKVSLHLSTSSCILSVVDNIMGLPQNKCIYLGFFFFSSFRSRQEGQHVISEISKTYPNFYIASYVALKKLLSEPEGFKPLPVNEFIPDFTTFKCTCL